MFSGGTFAGRFRDGEVGRECGCSAVNPFDVVWYRCVCECDANNHRPHESARGNESERVKGVESEGGLGMSI